MTTPQTNVWRALDISTAVGGWSQSVKAVFVFRHWRLHPPCPPSLSSLHVGIDTRELDQLFVNLTIENTKTSLSLCCYFTEVDAVQGSQCFSTKAVQYADYVTREHVVITNGWHTIPVHYDNFREMFTNHTSTRVLYECQLVINSW